jgi:hypothetical protein
LHLGRRERFEAQERERRTAFRLELDTYLDRAKEYVEAQAFAERPGDEATVWNASYRASAARVALSLSAERVSLLLQHDETEIRAILLIPGALARSGEVPAAAVDAVINTIGRWHRGTLATKDVVSFFEERLASSDVVLPQGWHRA